MAVTLSYRNAGAGDLHRRGLHPATAPEHVLLADIEADLAIRDGDHVVWDEILFPVAELACALVDWLRQPGPDRGDFAFDSMSYPEPGAVRIAGSDEGWRVGSAFVPGAWTSPVDRDGLEAEIRRFVAAVRQDVETIGAPPGLIPGL